MKPCRKCGDRLEPRPAWLGSGDNICGPCRREYFRAYRAARKAAGNTVRSTPEEPARKSARDKEYYSRVSGRREYRDRRAARSARANERHPERRAARKAAQRAIASGRLIRQPCEVCGSANVHAHHDDYSQPLSVRWLCTTHHTQAHRLGQGRNFPVTSTT